jgi:hypothetical protein
MPIPGKVQGPLAAFLFALATPAFASSLSQPPLALNKPPPAVTRQEARDIAWRLGIVQIEEIALYGVRWEIAGRDEKGDERVLDLSAYDGRVLN